MGSVAGINKPALYLWVFEYHKGGLPVGLSLANEFALGGCVHALHTPWDNTSMLLDVLNL